jgi:hypothetical protein
MSGGGGAEDSERILRILLVQTGPEDRERLKVAWERHAGGDPHSLPALYALADRFSLMAHAALLERQEKLLEAFHGQWGGTVPLLPPPRRKSGKTGAWIAGALCGLLAGLSCALLLRPKPAPLPAAGERGAAAMMERIQSAGGSLKHYVSRRDGRMFQILELSTTGKPPEAWLTPERHGILMFEDTDSSPHKR